MSRHDEDADVGVCKLLRCRKLARLERREKDVERGRCASEARQRVQHQVERRLARRFKHVLCLEGGL